MHLAHRLPPSFLFPEDKSSQRVVGTEWLVEESCGQKDSTAFPFSVVIPLLCDLPRLAAFDRHTCTCMPSPHRAVISLDPMGPTLPSAE